MSLLNWPSIAEYPLTDALTVSRRKIRFPYLKLNKSSLPSKSYLTWKVNFYILLYFYFSALFCSFSLLQFFTLTFIHISPLFLFLSLTSFYCLSFIDSFFTITIFPHFSLFLIVETYKINYCNNKSLKK
jgi:hypothetical protein